MTLKPLTALMIMSILVAAICIFDSCTTIAAEEQKPEIQQKFRVQRVVLGDPQVVFMFLYDKDTEKPIGYFIADKDGNLFRELTVNDNRKTETMD